MHITKCLVVSVLRQHVRTAEARGENPHSEAARVQETVPQQRPGVLQTFFWGSGILCNSFCHNV